MSTGERTGTERVAFERMTMLELAQALRWRSAKPEAAISRSELIDVIRERSGYPAGRVDCRFCGRHVDTYEEGGVVLMVSHRDFARFPEWCRDGSDVPAA
jgi:hypothetical protein